MSLDLFFRGSGFPGVPIPPARLDLFFGGGAGYPAPPTPPAALDLFFTGPAGFEGTGPPEPGAGGEYIPTYRPRRR